jgi:outer membrane protein insertion porin family
LSIKNQNTFIRFYFWFRSNDVVLVKKINILLLSFLLGGINLALHAEQDVKVDLVQKVDQSEDATVTDQDIVEEEAEDEPEEEDEELSADDFTDLEIKKIILHRNHKNNYLTDAVIYNSIPYQKGELFSVRKTTQLINKLYKLGLPFGYFEQVLVAGDAISDDSMDLHIITYEKPSFIDLEVKGNYGVTTKDIKKALGIEHVHAMSKIDLPIVKQKLQKLYRSKDYHFPEILVELVPVKNASGSKQVKLLVNIIEGSKSRVRRVLFKGNHHVPAKRLRNVIFTREDWLLGMLSKAGSYRPENLAADKHFIKNYYKTRGYLMANVAEVDVSMDPDSKQFDVCFTVEEGDKYTVSGVEVEGGSSEVSNDFLLAHLPVQKGDLYSEKAVRDAAEMLRTIWGEQGYVFVDTSPITIPDVASKTVSLNFNVDLGNKVHVNRINIVGNKKTRDKVVRRKLVIAEGDLLTNIRMDMSKDKVLQLGYFDMRNGANWKIHRLDDEWADIDLILQEKKTGRVGTNMGYGGGAQSMSSSNAFRVGVEAYDTNVFGKGYLLKLGGEWSKESWTVNTMAANPWLFDRPIMGKLGFHVTKNDYDDELSNVDSFNERRIGASGGIGFMFNPSRMLETMIENELAFDDIHFSKRPQVALASDNTAVALLQSILDKRFQEGGLLTLSNSIRQDFRNSSEHPSRGYQWSLNSKIGFGVGSNNVGYGKCELDASWYTPLIGDHDLVFGMHGHFGAATGLCSQQIPYKEMFHVGGPTSVRGFLYGNIGPFIKTGTSKTRMASIGSKKAFYVNAELIFPITANMAMKGALFYDGGAGWDTPGYDLFSDAQKELIQGNSFDYRHAVGFGVRMLQPQPMKIDWGFKLDRRTGEPHMEVHFSAYREF